MKIVEYLKDRFKYIVLFIIIISIFDIYLFVIDIFKHRYEELLYFIFLILIISFIFFIIDYINLKNKYKDILRCLDVYEEIDTYLISGKCIEDNIMKGIIVDLKLKNDEEVKEYRKNLKELDEYIAKWVHEIKIPKSA